MEDEVRRVDPYALRDPRDELMFTEEMEINDVYYSYLASQRAENALAITDGPRSEEEDDFGRLRVFFCPHFCVCISDIFYLSMTRS